MRPEWRAFGLLASTVLGLATLIGSGGGISIGFPPCGPPICTGEPPPPNPNVAIQPTHVTAQVATQVRFTAAVSDSSGPFSYQWRRSSNGGASFADIPGATTSSLTLPGVNLLDDGTVFQVEVRIAGGITLRAESRLLVSATPGIVFEDGQFAPQDWLVSPAAVPGVPPPEHSAEPQASGGNPNAWRRMVYRVPQGTGSAAVAYLSQTAVYDPRVRGAIRVIDYSEDCIALQASSTSFTESSVVIEQGNRTYLWAVTPQSCVAQSWSTVAQRASLAPSDFRLFDGPACATGEACPNFSATGLPLRFGYRRITFATPGVTIGHGIDNWRVTVWRQ